MSGPSGHGVALALAGGVLAVWLGLTAFALDRAQLPEDAAGMVLAVFAPGTPDQRAFDAVVAAGGRPLRKTWVGFAWVADAPEPGFVGRLRAAGALAAYGELPLAGPALGGCAVVSADAARPASFRLQP